MTVRILNTYTEYVPPDNVLTPDEILALCCADTPLDECSEVGKVTPYEGADQDQWSFSPDMALDQARSDNPIKRIVSVQTEGIGPRPGEPCGEKHEDWQGQNNCCDFVVPLEWDFDNSAEVIVPGGMAVVRVLGGSAPYRVSVRGEGFTLDGYRLRDGVYTTPVFFIFAEDFACGWCPIEVNDGCSIVRHGIRSTLGQWVEVIGAAPCQYPGRGTINWNETKESIFGEYKVRQICGQNAVNCTYFWLPPCTEAEVAAAVSWVCAYLRSPQYSCFDVPETANPCADGKTYWEYDGDRAVKAYVFSNYKAWRWQC